MDVKGYVHKYGDNVDTDVIIPARYLNTSDKRELASHCMEDIDAEFTKKVKEGDIILTSGLGYFYPKGLRIGEVISVSEDKVKVNKSAIIKPYVDFNKLEELFIIIPKDTSQGIKYEE